MKEWVESFQGRITRCPRVLLWPLGGAYHPSLVTYQNPGEEGPSSFWGSRVAGSQDPDSRAFAHTLLLLLPSLLSTAPTPPRKSLF